MEDNLVKARGIIKTSGNNFHSKVVKYFQDRGWSVLISPFYTDNITSKPREIDIIAEKIFEVATFSLKKRIVNVQLFLECKYLNNISVFWFHERDDVTARQLVAKIIGINEENIYIHKFHYMDGHDKVAKLFSSKKGRTSEHDPFYKALNQCLNAYIYFKGSRKIIGGTEDPRLPIHKIVTFPVIVCSSFEKVFKTKIGGALEPEKITENFLLEVNYAYMTSSGRSQNEYFLVDIVEFDQLDKFLQAIYEDTKVAGNLL